MPSVLIADDEVDLARLTRMRLDAAGLDAVECYDGSTALQILRESRPAVAILDWMMPGMDGLELARLVRADDALKNTRLILMTARVEAETEEGFAERHGFDVVLIKPVPRADLIATVLSELQAARVGA
ncbi:response regulator [Microbacterium sp. 5K110]|uniref:response regulator n=1 Tax=unclassified Microbacterium TaxID=2609290 RepID=UPI0010FD4007|nr:response regulator [Microbacterium sp. 5K110]TLF32224.1 response regulator [Microbacterium sp. 5K110]